MIDYVTKHSSITAWGMICHREALLFLGVFKWDSKAFYRYILSLGYDVTYQRVIEGLKETFDLGGQQ